MASHQSKGLDVHDELFWCPCGPALDHRLVRQAVVRRVDLDRVEVLGVVGESIARLDTGRIPVLRERLVGPGTRADADLRHAPSIREGARKGPARESRILAARAGSGSCGSPP